MKTRTFVAKIVAIVALISMIVASAVIFAACDKKKTKSITDIFKMRSSYGELNDSKLEFILPAGWEVYTNSTSSSSSSNVSQNSDVGYIPALNAFVVSLKEGSSTKLSVVKCDDKTVYREGLIPGMMFGPDQGIRALRYKDGIIACLFDDGRAGAFDATSGREILSRFKLGKDVYDPSNDGRLGYSDANSASNIDTVIKILCSNMIAVHFNYDHSGARDYTSIYRPTYQGDQRERGELVCRVYNTAGALAQVNGFDNRYVSVSGTSTGEYMFRIPDHAPSNGAQSLQATSRGSLTTNNNTNYSDESTYIGNGKFFVSQDWEVSKGTDYTYYNGSNYIVSKQGIYNAEKDSFTAISSDRIFNNLTNNYYTSSKAGIDTSSYLNDGYTYVSYGLTIYEADNGDKLGLYDQYIVDSDLDIVLSLTGNYGVKIESQTRDKVSLFDMIMYGVDGLYYVPYHPSEINIFDKNGKIVGHNDRSEIIMQEFNSNIMVAQMPDGDSSSSYLYGAYDRFGQLIVPFQYDMLASFRGPYTIGRRYGRKGVEGESVSTRDLYLIGPNGAEFKEVEIRDKDGNITTRTFREVVAYSSASSKSITNAIYKTGCYMFRIDSGERTSNGDSVYNYGVRNFRPGYYDSLIMEPTMAAGCILYSPSTSPSDVFVFNKITGANTSAASYEVYRLISR